MSDTVLSIECNEPEGKVTRNIRRLIFTPENLQRFWDEAKQFPTIYGREIKSVADFYEMFISQNGEELTANGLFWVIDDFVGVFYMTEITTTEANVHYSFFDKRHRGRENLTRQMVKFIFEKYKFNRVNVEIPLYSSKYTRFFVNNIGFKLEGRKRKAAYYKGEWYDTMLYGMLNSEAFDNGRTQD